MVRWLPAFAAPSAPTAAPPCCSALAGDGGSGAEVSALAARVGQERLPGPVEHAPPRLQHVAAVAQLERFHHPLLHQQDGQPSLAPDAVDGLEDLLDDARAQPLRGLVEQEEI